MVIKFSYFIDLFICMYIYLKELEMIISGEKKKYCFFFLRNLIFIWIGNNVVENDL